ncbi:hypothetical protein pb186bvf_001651 [Paramecium bursaria]
MLFVCVQTKPKNIIKFIYQNIQYYSKKSSTIQLQKAIPSSWEMNQDYLYASYAMLLQKLYNIILQNYQLKFSLKQEKLINYYDFQILLIVLNGNQCNLQCFIQRFKQLIRKKFQEIFSLAIVFLKYFMTKLIIYEILMKQSVQQMKVLKIFIIL